MVMSRAVRQSGGQSGGQSGELNASLRSVGCLSRGPSSLVGRSVQCVV